ncbi:MAG: tetratricopeptide repeat protein [candidate division Zixibacteria bacterium]|nr:tetratricopeptide repeat protein [candidate division Zixibacteria bacterium]
MITPRPAHAQEPSRLFDESVSAYQRGLFDSAASGFLRLAQGGIDDPRVWYNLGNAHFKSGRIGSALVSYRRGLRLQPRDADLRANYRYVRLFAADKIEPVGGFFLETWWRALVDRIAFHEARALAAMIFWLAVVLTAWRLWPGPIPIRPVATWVVTLAWILWVGATGTTATCYFRDIGSRDGAVIALKTDVRGGPGGEYALQFVAHDGLEGTVERSESGWYLARFPNGLKGWIDARAFEII